jgi:hypothetical protein
MVAGAPGVLVRLKVADKVPALAVTVYEPAWLLAVNVPELACPELSVATVIVPVELENVPLCSKLPGLTVKVTVTPGTPSPLESCTVATSGLGKDVPITVIWPVPPLAVMLAGSPLMVWVKVPLDPK